MLCSRHSINQPTARANESVAETISPDLSGLASGAFGVGAATKRMARVVR